LIEQIWREFDGSPVVVQQPANNLTGRGTRLLRDWREFSDTLVEWGTGRLKVSRHMDGIPLTISGCVGPAQTIISAISKQLVGLPRLTCFWGAHCGNQLINTAELGEKREALCFDACLKVGDELRRRGFLGAFGLDLMMTPENEIYVVEINPRLQSVSSLVNICEIESGVLPLPGVHLLAFLLDELPVAELVGASVPTSLSQLVLYARRQGIISRVPESGAYRLENGTLKTADWPMSLHHLSTDEVLIWVFSRLGDHVQNDTRLCVFQARFSLAEKMTPNILTDSAMQLTDAVESLFKY
jgi:predicted ATP-grasp superfamily ATP-dependent carboligase